MTIKITIDKLSGHDNKAVVGRIYKTAGEEIAVGDVLFTLESSKGTQKYTSEYDGIIKSLDIAEGDTVKKNQAVGTIHGEAGKEYPKECSNYSFGLSTPAKEDIHCDVLVIGGGPGGYVAAIRAAQLGQKTILVEKDQLGGTCLNYGCIPTKALVQSTELLRQMKDASRFGFEASGISINFGRVMSRKDDVIRQLVSGIQSLMEDNQIRVLNGEATVTDSETVNVKTNRLDATIKYKKMIIAAGSSPIRLPIPGADLCEVLTSKEALELTEIPSSMTIIGGGVIGMEIAFIYNELGCSVSVVEFLPKILSTLDADVCEIVRQSAIEKGIHIYDGAQAKSIRKTMNNMMVTEIEVDDENYLISSEKVLMAVGRRANLDALDLETLGVQLNERENGIQVDDFMMTSNENIYAIGDITNKIQLAHVASHQGMTAAEHICNIENAMHYDLVPSAVFTIPEVGAVGCGEIEAEKLAIDYKVVKFPFTACGKAVAMSKPEGFAKLIVDKSSMKIIGGSIVGAHATDMLATITQLIRSEVTIEEAIKTIYAHPTLGEVIHEALLMADERGIHFR